MEALVEDQREQARRCEETSLSNEKRHKRCESRIRHLQTQFRRLHESTDQTLDEKQQVVQTHINIQTLLHKQHTYTSHDVR